MDHTGLPPDAGRAPAPSRVETVPAPSGRRAQTRRRVLDAAAEVFAEQGLVGATVDDVARAAGFTKGAVYSNFATKEQLFLEVFLDQTQQLLQIVRHAVDPGASLTDVHELISTLLDRLEPSSRRWYLLNLEFMTFTLRSPSGAAMADEAAQHLRCELGEVFSAALAIAGRRPTVEADVLIDIVTGLYLHGISRRAALSDGEVAGRLALRTALPAALLALTEPVDTLSPHDARS